MSRCEKLLVFAASCSFSSTQTKQDTSSFDCAARQHGTSLNEQLLPGPDLLNSLIGVLTRFKKGRIAFVANIEAMYHQVRVNPKDQKYLRFLWWPTGNTSISPLEYCVTVHVFEATSSPTCANYAMQQTDKNNVHLYSDEVVQTVAENFYMDDCLKSLHSVNEAITLSVQLTKLQKKGGFDVFVWVECMMEFVHCGGICYRKLYLSFEPLSFIYDCLLLVYLQLASINSFVSVSHNYL